jgi:hypothetical protein
MFSVRPVHGCHFQAGLIWQYCPLNIVNVPVTVIQQKCSIVNIVIIHSYYKLQSNIGSNNISRDNACRTLNTAHCSHNSLHPDIVCLSWTL